MNKVQQKQFEILCEIDRICKKNKIKYFMMGGTFLGAVRHKGFIPWDDDLDVGMLREDYIKFEEACKKDLNSKYFYQNAQTDKYFGYIFSKIRINNTKYVEEMSKNSKAHCGVFVDVFPIDYYSNKSILDFKKVLIYRMLLLLKNNYSIKTKTFLKKMELFILKFLTLFYSRERLLNNINKIISRNGKECNQLINFCTATFNKCLIGKEFYTQLSEYEFEGKKFPGPKKYDEFLSYLYGDYMKLPPKEKRQTHGIIEIELND